MQDQKKKFICCRNLFIATGLSVPIRPKAFGDLRYIENYDTVSTRPENFEGQSVLILGRGNSGMEVANSIYGLTNYVHLMARSRVKLSWDTHYVGDIRAINNDIIDAYMLKSLDGFLEVDVQHLNIERRKDGSGKLDIVPPPGLSWEMYNFAERAPSRYGYDRIIACLGFKWDGSIFSSNLSISKSKLNIKNYDEPIGRRSYQTFESDKYPMIDNGYRSVDYPGLYFIGALSHSLDYKRSAGGFIHGFRYTIRSLHKILEYQNHGIKWPSKVFKIKRLANRLLDRANEASGLYQMFGQLCDVAIVNK
uniref:Flavin-containing monooxygenase n=1 Tax=Romanomermis culicivorax TaxID=13658 RepID=A0A915II25_ROMCU